MVTKATPVIKCEVGVVARRNLCPLMKKLEQMGPDRRDGAGGQGSGRRGIPVPPVAVPEATKVQSATSKSGIPSPRRRTASGLSRTKDVIPTAILTAPSSTVNKRLPQTANSKISKSLLRPGSSQPCDDKDDVRQRDNGQKDNVHKRDSIQRDKAVKDTGLRRPISASETVSSTDPAKRVLKQPSVLLRQSTTANCTAASPSTSAPKAVAPTAPAKPLPRSVSTCRDRIGTDTRTSMMRRSMSVGKGRAVTTQPEQPTQLAGARMRPIIERPAATSGAAYRHSADKRDTSNGHMRPASGSAKSDVPLSGSGRPTLTTISEAPARPAPQGSGGGAAAQTKVTPTPQGSGGGAATQTKTTPSRPAFSLNLSALKQHTAAAAPPPPVEPCASFSSDDPGPPVPKLDLGGILQRRAEEQASEPVFLVAASSEDTGQPSASASQSAQLDKRKSGSRQPSAKEEPAEHFYLYPKVNPQEKKRIEDICRVVPKRQQAAITDLFGKMVEARQNCEQMCFRGHRLLDQAQAEFRNRLAQKEEEVAQTKEEAQQWRQEAELLRAQLALLLGARQEECAEEAQGSKGLEATEEERAMYLRNSLLSTFDNMAQLGAPGLEAFGGEGQDIQGRDLQGTSGEEGQGEGGHEGQDPSSYGGQGV